MIKVREFARIRFAFALVLLLAALFWGGVTEYSFALDSTPCIARLKSEYSSAEVPKSLEEHEKTLLAQQNISDFRQRELDESPALRRGAVYLRYLLGKGNLVRWTDIGSFGGKAPLQLRNSLPWNHRLLLTMVSVSTPRVPSSAPSENAPETDPNQVKFIQDYFENIARSLPCQDVITDHFAGLAYSAFPSRFLEVALNTLRPGGELHSDFGITEVQTLDGRRIPLARWIAAKIDGVQVTFSAHNGDDLLSSTTQFQQRRRSFQSDRPRHLLAIGGYPKPALDQNGISVKRKAQSQQKIHVPQLRLIQLESTHSLPQPRVFTEVAADR